jgi:hypothetical protein
VKVSYFPNWTAHGAEGPYRIAPNLMVVVPTSNDVSLTFERSGSDLFFYALTGIGILLLIASRIWGDRVLAALDARRERAAGPAFAVAGWASSAPADDFEADAWTGPSEVTWGPPDVTPPGGVPRPGGEAATRSGDGPNDAIRDVDDDPATDAGSEDGAQGSPLA